MFSSAKKILPVLIFIILFFTLAKNADAKVMSASFVGTPVVTDGKIEFDFIVDNPDGDKSWGIKAKVGDGGLADYYEKGCQINPAYDVNNFAPQQMRATCDMTNSIEGDYPLIILNNGVSVVTDDVIGESPLVHYGFGSVRDGGFKFQPAPYQQEDGKWVFSIDTYTLFNFIVKTGYISIHGQKPPWNGGTSYNCPSMTFVFSPNAYIKTSTCDLSLLTPGDYTIDLVQDQNVQNIISKYPAHITIKYAELISVTNISSGTSQNPNLFDIKVARYSTGAPKDFKLKVKNSNGAGYLANIPTYALSYAGTGPFTFFSLDYNMLPPGSYTVELFDGTDTPLKSTKPLEIKKNILYNTCGCEITPSVQACSATTFMRVTTRSCITPTVATPTCVDPRVDRHEINATCSCTCVGTPMESPIPPAAPGTPISPAYGVEDLAEIFKTAQNVIIGIAVLSGVFIIPYAFVLMASGNPENIKKGSEMLKSIFWGYLIIFLSGALIRFVGGEFLSFGI